MHRLYRPFLLTLIVALAAAITGCADVPATIARAAAWRDDAAGARDRIAQDLHALRAARDAVPDDHPTAPDLDAAISAADARLAALDAALTHADRVLTEMTTPTDGLTRAADALSPILPPPARGPVLLGAALIATLLRARQVRQGAASIAASIEKALDDPDFKAAFRRHADTIRTIQTPTARRIVDQATRPGLIRSPI